MTFRDASGAATSAFVPRGASGPATPVFLVPALGLDGRSFVTLAPLAAERRVVLWSPPNALPSSPGLGALAALTIEHADRAGMPRRFVLAGTSLGAVIALAAALAAPERIAGLVLAGGVSRWRDLGAPMRFARLLHPFIPRRHYHRIAPRILAPGDPSGDEILAALHRQMGHRTKEYAAAVIAALTGAGRFDLSPRLGEVRAPTLVAHARGDRVAPYAAAKRLATIPGARFVTLETGSHLPHLTHPDAFLPPLREFLAHVDARERC